jgi:hypothetical protein
MSQCSLGWSAALRCMNKRDGKWDTIRYALDSWPRTGRLVVIILVMDFPSLMTAIGLILLR